MARILVSCLQDFRRHAIPPYRHWRHYFRKGIIEAGHEYAEIPDVDWAEGCTFRSGHELASWKEKTWSRTLEWIKAELAAGRNIDLFLSYFFPQQVDSTAIGEIKRLGIPCVNFFCDNIREFTRVPAVFHCFDLNWVPEFEALPMYEKQGLKTCFAPMPCWVAKEARTPVVNENGQITFIGSSDILRRTLFAKALSLGVPVKIGGAGWGNESSSRTSPPGPDRSVSTIVRNQARILRDQGMSQWFRRTVQRLTPTLKDPIPASALLNTITDSDYVKLTKESTITLGVNRVPTFRASLITPLTYSRLRDIEAPMMGACYLTEWTEGLTHFYDVGKEIETYRSAQEMAAKIAQLKSDKQRRFSLRTAGQRRALSDLTIGKSVGKICHTVGVSTAKTN